MNPAARRRSCASASRRLPTPGALRGRIDVEARELPPSLRRPRSPPTVPSWSNDPAPPPRRRCARASAGTRSSARPAVARGREVARRPGARSAPDVGDRRRRRRSVAGADHSRCSSPITGDSGSVGTRADREQHAGHERLAVGRVVADRQRLADVAEDDLLVGDEPGQAHRVDRHLAVHRAMRAVRAAVPLGASSLRSWCSSMISALAKCLRRPRRRSASSARRRSRSSGATKTLRRGARPLAQRLGVEARSCRSRRARRRAGRPARWPAPCRAS